MVSHSKVRRQGQSPDFCCNLSTTTNMDLLLQTVVWSSVLAIVAGQMREDPTRRETRQAPGMIGINIWANNAINVDVIGLNSPDGPFLNFLGVPEGRMGYKSDVDEHGILQIGPTQKVACPKGDWSSISVYFHSNAMRQISIASPTNLTVIDVVPGDDFTLVTKSSAMGNIGVTFLTIKASGSSQVNPIIGSPLLLDATVSDNAQVTFTEKASTGKVSVRGSGRFVANTAPIDVVSTEVYDKGYADVKVGKKMLVNKDNTGNVRTSDMNDTIIRVQEVISSWGKSTPQPQHDHYRSAPVDAWWLERQQVSC